MATPIPVQDTNVLAVLHTHLPREHGAVLTRIVALETELASLKDYRDLLGRIAETAGVPLTISHAGEPFDVQPPDPQLLPDARS